MVLDEAYVENVLSQDTKVEHAMKAVAVVDANMANKLEDQWIPQYLSRVLPWVLNLDAAAAAADPFLVVRLGILYDVLCCGCVYGNVHVCCILGGEFLPKWIEKGMIISILF